MLGNFSKSITPTKIYVGAKGSALILSLGFSIIYSRLLGLENRSVLTFIFTVSSLLILGFISSLGLTFRQSISKSDNQSLEVQQYIRSLFFLTLFLTGIYTIILFYYSYFVTPLNLKIFGLSLILFCTSSVIQGFNELLIGLDRLRTIGLIENMEIVIQILLFFMFYKVFALSIIISIIFSISITYILSTVIIWRLTSNQLKLNLSYLLRRNPNYNGKLRIFDSSSLTITLPFVLLDRLDKILIAIVLPLSFLSQYSVLLIFFSLGRSIPESFSKTLFSKKRTRFHRGQSSLKLYVIFLFFVSLSAYPLYITSTKFLLGTEWLLPLNVFLATIAFELLRSTYLFRINLYFAGDLASSFKFIHVWYFIVFSCLSILISTHFMGLIGAPLSMLGTYGSMLIHSEIVVRRRDKKL